jgi:hypothetical protein
MTVSTVRWLTVDLIYLLNLGVAGCTLISMNFPDFVYDRYMGAWGLHNFDASTAGAGGSQQEHIDGLVICESQKLKNLITCIISLEKCASNGLQPRRLYKLVGECFWIVNVTGGPGRTVELDESLFMRRLVLDIYKPALQLSWTHGQHDIQEKQSGRPPSGWMGSRGHSTTIGRCSNGTRHRGPMFLSNRSLTRSANVICHHSRVGASTNHYHDWYVYQYHSTIVWPF